MKGVLHSVIFEFCNSTFERCKFGNLETYVFITGFAQLKELSFKMTTAREGGVCVDRIYYAFFSKAICLCFLSLLILPSPYEDSHVQMSCGNPGLFFKVTSV